MFRELESDFWGAQSQLASSLCKQLRVHVVLRSPRKVGGEPQGGDSGECLGAAGLGGPGVGICAPGPSPELRLSGAGLLSLS